MSFINWGDIKRSIFAIFIIILPTIILGTYLDPILQRHQITGTGLWNLKLSNTPDLVIEKLQILRLKPYFFKFRLMNDIESRIGDEILYKKIKKNIESQISVVAMNGVEYIFIIILAFYYFILWFY